MADSGSTTITFGAFPGASDVTVTVAAAGVGAGSEIEAWIFPVATADHTVDEHIIDPPRIVAHSVNAGVGFSVTAVAQAPIPETVATGQPVASMGPITYGIWTIGWAWA